MERSKTRRLMHSGWLKLHRKFKKNFLWTERRVFSRWEAFEDLFTEANFTDGEMLFEGRHIKVARGQLVTSQPKLTKRWLWSRRKVKRFLKMCSASGMLRIQHMDRKASMITICNFDTYQDNDTTDSTTDEQQTRQQTGHNIRRGRNKEGKEYIYSPSESMVNIFSFWNSQNGLKHHRELTREMQSAFEKSGLSQAEVIQAVGNYGKVLADEDSFFSYRWTLERFLKQENAARRFVSDDVLQEFKQGKKVPKFGAQPI
jgi:hypothetical protein